MLTFLMQDCTLGLTGCTRYHRQIAKTAKEIEMSRSIRVNPHKMDAYAAQEVQQRKRKITKAEKAARRADKADSQEQ